MQKVTYIDAYFSLGADYNTWLDIEKLEGLHRFLREAWL